MARGLMLLLLCCLSVANTGHTNEIEKNRGVVVGFHDGRVSGDYGLQFNYVVTFRLSAMLNEPVYEVTLTWSFDERARIAMPFRGGMILFGGEAIRELDPKVRDSLRPYDLKVRIEGHAADNPQSTYLLIWDVGVPGSSGEPSYNTPASPAWSELFHRQTGGARSYISADEAKAVVRAGFIADRVRIESIQWRTDDYLRDMHQRQAKLVALKRSAERHIDLLSQLQGLPRDKLDTRLGAILDALEERRRKGDPNFLAELEQLVARFENGLPAPMRNGGLSEQYSAALVDIRRQYEAELTAAANRSFGFRLADPYPAWLESKNVELGARRPIKAGIYSGVWDLFRRKRYDSDKVYDLYESNLYKTRCLVSKDSGYNNTDVDCGGPASRCSLKLDDNMRFVLRMDDDAHQCEVVGSYQYTHEDHLRGRSDDGCFKLHVGPGYGRGEQDPSFPEVYGEDQRDNCDRETRYNASFTLFMRRRSQ